MLFDKHRRHNYAATQNKRSNSYCLFIFKCLTIHNKEMNRQRIVHMNARKQIRSSICTVQPFTNHGKDIVMRKVCRTKIMSVRIQSRYYKKHCHPRKKYCAQLIVVLLIVNRRIDDAPCHISEPQHIWYNKIFTKRNHIIHCKMNDMKTMGYGYFEIMKPWKINKQIQNGI